MTETILTIQCLDCGKVMEGQTGVNDDSAVPHDGAISMCLICGSVAVFERSAAQGVRRLTEEEAKKIYRDTDIINAVLTMNMMRATGQLPATYQMQKTDDLMTQDDLDKQVNGTIIFDWDKHVLIKRDDVWRNYIFAESPHESPVTLPARMIFAGDNEGWGSVKG